jgi:Fur family ferric uptake transcriptional regulator
MQEDNNNYLINKLKQSITKNNMKHSKQREYIFETLIDMEHHSTPEELYDEIKIKNKAIGISTIYRTLSYLEKENLIKSISFGALGKKYEAVNQKQHDHIICNSCGEIVEFIDESINSIKEKILKTHNFRATKHGIELYGTCEVCQTK